MGFITARCRNNEKGRLALYETAPISTGEGSPLPAFCGVRKFGLQPVVKRVIFRL